MLPVLHLDADPPEFTDPGVGIPTRPPAKSERQAMLYLQSADGSFLAAFDAGLFGQYIVCASRGAR